MLGSGDGCGTVWGWIRAGRCRGDAPSGATSTVRVAGLLLPCA